MIQKKLNFFFSSNFFINFRHKSLDPDPGSGSGLNQCGSETLVPGTPHFHGSRILLLVNEVKRLLGPETLFSVVVEPDSVNLDPDFTFHFIRIGIRVP